jgi:EpsI family protein
VIARGLIVVAMLTCATLVGARANEEAPVVRESLSTLPYALERWQGREAAPLAGDVVAQLGVDDYINRTYTSAGGVPIGLYAGYYTSQRQGHTIHSPQNCLPGAGWQPIQSSTVLLVAGGRRLPVNQYLIQKGVDRQVVLYWYQGRGRVVANEFANKAYLMWDAASLRRTNGGLVRVISPLPRSGGDSVADAIAFATAIVPRLDRLMP